MGTPKTDALCWRKSTASGTANCVEVAGSGETVLVRDSKDRSGPMLAFTRGEWEAFLTGIRQGEFDVETLLP